jgi:hypothetical protein
VEAVCCGPRISDPQAKVDISDQERVGHSSMMVIQEARLVSIRRENAQLHQVCKK